MIRAIINTLKNRKKLNQSGFTLLELLVVVAILAAIAGTATIALQDTDARASAAAHVAMMDELNKGVRTFRVLQKNVLPNNLDSLCYIDSGSDASAASLLPNGTTHGDIFAVEGDIRVGSLLTGAAEVMAEIGMTHLRYIDGGATLADVGAGGCDPEDGVLQATVANRSNAMVGGNIFNGKAGNGCGRSVTLADADNVAYWTGAIERIIGAGAYGDAHFDITTRNMISTSAVKDAEAPVLLAVGFGPASNLFNTQKLGAMTSVPVYRHVTGDQYNRFIGLFQIGTSTCTVLGAGTGTETWTTEATDQIAFVGVVDGAGDTKEEELGEWDGTRNTI